MWIGTAVSGTSHLIGELARSEGYVDESALLYCLELQEQFAATGKPIRLGEIFIARGHMTRGALSDLLGLQNRLRGSGGASNESPGSSAGLTVMDSNIAEVKLRAMAQEKPAQSASDGSPTRLGSFVLEKRLSKGGMGSVYLARKEGENRFVALKVLDPVSGSSEELVTRFRREAQFLLAIDHLNIVTAYEVGTVEGRHFLSMEYVEGEHLGTRMDREGVIDPIDALGIMRQVARALEYADECHLVHRDVKPQNVLIRQDGLVKLADMGLAILANREDLRLTAPGTLVGTPAYMSPEQVRSSRHIDIRSDIYSLGCTFFHAVCGQTPFDGHVVKICQHHLYDEPPLPTTIRPGLLPAMESLLLKCMQKKRDARYQTCAELIRKIDQILGPKPGRAVDEQEGATPKPRPKTSMQLDFGFSTFPQSRPEGRNRPDSNGRTDLP